MPDALGDDDGVSCAQVDSPVAFWEFEADSDGAGDQVEQFVAVGVDLTGVRGVAGELGCSNGEPINALRSPARLLNEPGPPVGTIEANHLASQVDASTWLDLVRRRHAISSCESRGRRS